MKLEQDRLVLRKLALEAFGMVLEGKSEEPKIVFKALEAVMPGNRPSALGLALIDFSLERHSDYSRSVGEAQEEEDPVLTCFRAIGLSRAGAVSQAKALLLNVSRGRDSDAAKLAQDIIQYQLSIG